MKKIAGIIFSLCFVLVGKAQTPDVWDETSDTTWYNTTDTLFQLTTAEQLAGLAVMVNNGNSFQGKTIELMNDVDLGGALETPLNWKPIGYIYTDTLSFSGIFDGNNHSIKKMFIEQSLTDTVTVGLFGVVNMATIKNLFMKENVAFNIYNESNTNDYCGVLVGCSFNSNILYCYIESTLVLNTSGFGGIVGEAYYSCISYCIFNGKIESNIYGNGGISGVSYYSVVNNCISMAELKGERNVGGIVGISAYSNIYNNIFIGKCEVSDTYAGGITARSYYDTIENNFVITSQIGYGVLDIELKTIGGLFGLLDCSYIKKCYITGGVINNPSITGGVIGCGGDINVEDCYAATYISEQGEYSGNIAGLLNNSTINNTFMDNNIGAFDGVGYNYMGNGEVIGFFTEEMTSGNSFGLQDSVGIYPAKWVYEEGLYPQLDVFVNHPDTIFRQASLLSVIPIFLGEQSANQIRNDFKVSTLYGVSWTSSAEDIIRIEGENATVTRIDQDTMIVLTVTLNDLQKEFYVKVKQGNDIKEVHTNKINLYPNPSNFQFTLDNGQELMKEVFLYDVMGRKVKHLPVNAPSTTVDVSDLPNGIYVVKISTASGVLVRKVEVMR
ncbi:MAG: T9SS type A sorting domain-containing protein [Bacteroidales bacterium]|nr:T9SS type A sorting domain-containing protein [Bacteroidales bacterium]